MISHLAEVSRAFLSGRALDKRQLAGLGFSGTDIALKTLDPAQTDEPRAARQRERGERIERARVAAKLAATGASQRWTVSGAFGKELPVVGNNPNADTYVFKRINATTSESQYMKGGRSGAALEFAGRSAAQLAIRGFAGLAVPRRPPRWAVLAIGY
ncbi:MAG TPA: hypothetical protein VMV37_00335, partial [Gammaproteobacteria bacterium]|nr:hypothetical protein [Gammaproteobacteria bacterium]